MRRSAQLAILLLVTLMPLGGAGCRRLTDAERQARAQIEVYVDKDLTAPKFHEPRSRWRAVHGRTLKRRERSRYQCVLCHDPPRHCTKCHRQCRVKDAIDGVQADPDVHAFGRRTGVPAAKQTAGGSPRARSDVHGEGPPRAGAPATRSEVTRRHVEQMVQELAKRGQQMRRDGLPCLGEDNGLCLPCHTMRPGTARSLKPIHITMIEGMQVGLTNAAPKDIRRPLCVDCHAYPLANAEVLTGDLKFDMLRKPCVQSECHSDRDFKWALTFVGHLKQAIRHVPDDELFAVEWPNSGLDRRVLKRTGGVVSWLLVLAAFAGARFLRSGTDNGGETSDG